MRGKLTRRRAGRQTGTDRQTHSDTEADFSHVRHMEYVECMADGTLRLAA